MEKENIKFVWICLILVIVFIGGVLVGTIGEILKQIEISPPISPPVDNNQHYYNLDVIKENCGSLHIVERPGYWGLWVFTKVCLDGNYCKHDYINIEDCL